MKELIDKKAVLDYLEQQVEIYTDRLAKCQSFYYDGKIDAFREMYSILAVMPSERSGEK